MMMNKMREIYGVVNMILFPEDEDPGEDYIEHATKKNPVAVMGNGDVTGYVYIVKTHAL